MLARGSEIVGEKPTRWVYGIRGWIVEFNAVIGLVRVKGLDFIDAN
ncbi:MAG: hypothetical protein M2R46_00325 [Verrucomicrobia subdivision 3 bacterium]|nr:hypothetical protein [Limisphaerales bacterium]